jgi:hypothetical protein
VPGSPDRRARRAVSPRRRRRRRVLVAGAAIAGIVVVASAFRITPGLPPHLEGRQYDAGLATVQVLVDSPQSQVVDVGSTDTGLDGAAIDLASLSTRARLLGSLMAVSPSRERIASAGGVRPQTLIVLAPARADGAPRTTGTGVTVKIGEPGASIVDLEIDEILPIITVRVQAPDTRRAVALANATVAEVERRVAEDTASAKADPIPASRQVIVDALGEPTSATVVRGPRRMLALVSGLLVLALWLGGMQLMPRAAAAWRRERRLEASLQA